MTACSLAVSAHVGWNWEGRAVGTTILLLGLTLSTCRILDSRRPGSIRRPCRACWQKSELTDVTAKLVIYEAFIEGKLEVPKHLARTVHDLYFEPKYEDFRPRTIWRLSNAFSSAFKSQSSHFSRRIRPGANRIALTVGAGIHKRLLVAQRGHGIDTHCPSRRNVACEHGHRSQSHSHSPKRSRIGQLNPIHQFRHKPQKRQCARDARHRPCHGQPHPLPHYQQKNVAASRSQRHPHPDRKSTRLNSTHTP